MRELGFFFSSSTKREKYIDRKTDFHLRKYFLTITSCSKVGWATDTEFPDSGIIQFEANINALDSLNNYVFLHLFFYCYKITHR